MKPAVGFTLPSAGGDPCTSVSMVASKLSAQPHTTLLYRGHHKKSGYKSVPLPLQIFL